MEIPQEKKIPLEKIADEIKEHIASTTQKFIEKDAKIKKIPVKEVPELDSIINECEKDLGDNGRVLVRYSGTEKLIRVMIEARKYEIAENWAGKIVKVIEKHLC